MLCITCRRAVWHFCQISVAGSSPPSARTKTAKSTLDPVYNECHVFLLVPGSDEVAIKVQGKGTVPVMNKTVDDYLGGASVKVATLLSASMVEVKLDTQGTVTLGLQILPLAEASLLPAALAATCQQLEYSNARGDALEVQCKALAEALTATAEEAGAAKERAAAAAAEAAVAQAAIDSEKERVAYLQTQTAKAKAQQALAAAVAQKDIFLANSERYMAEASARLGVVKAGLSAGLGDALSGIKSGLAGAIAKDKAINGEAAEPVSEAAAE